MLVFCKKPLCLFGLVLMALYAQGCSTNAFGKLDNLVLGHAQDEKELGERAAKFQEALYWQDADLAAVYVMPELRRDFMRRAKELKAKERLTEADIQNIEVNRDLREAKVKVAIRYFEIPHYVLKTRKEQQLWEFSAEEGEWLLREVMIVLEDS